jgi:hypothetical protein
MALLPARDAEGEEGMRLRMRARIDSPHTLDYTSTNV